MKNRGSGCPQAAPTANSITVRSQNRRHNVASWGSPGTPTSTSAGQESTPLVVDGVHLRHDRVEQRAGLRRRTGATALEFDPEVTREWGGRACCDVVNRGAALWNGKIFVGTIDGRMIALDAATGTKVWERDTLIRRDVSYSITGAPRVVKGKVHHRQRRRRVWRARLCVGLRR